MLDFSGYKRMPQKACHTCLDQITEALFGFEAINFTDFKVLKTINSFSISQLYLCKFSLYAYLSDNKRQVPLGSTVCVNKWFFSRTLMFDLFVLIHYTPVNNFFRYVRTGLSGLNQY